MEIVIVPKLSTPVLHKLAQAELHFDRHDGVLAGLLLRGFEIWEPAYPGAGPLVTLPSCRIVGRDGPRPYPLLRSRLPAPDASEPLRSLIAARYVITRPSNGPLPTDQY